MEYRRAYSFFRGDPGWPRKVALASLAFFVPMVGTILLEGWLSGVFREMVAGREAALPPIEASKIGPLLTAGVAPYLVNAVYSAPILPIVVVVYLLRLLLWVEVRSTALQVAAWAVGITVIVVTTAAVRIVAFAAVTRAELSDDIRAGFHVREVARFARLVWWETLKLTVVTAVLNTALYAVGLLFFCVGVLPASVVTFLAQTHLRAQLYHLYLERGGEPIEGRLSIPFPPASPRAHQRPV